MKDLIDSIDLETFHYICNLAQTESVSIVELFKCYQEQCG